MLNTDPSGELVPIAAIAGIGFAAAALYDVYQQTNGFSNFCGYNIAQTLAWGVGGAVAATSAVIMAVSGVGLVGMGLQGTALGLFGLSSIPLLTSIIPKVTTPLFIAGNAAVGWSNTAMGFLFSDITVYSPSMKPGSSGGTTAGKPFSDNIRKETF